MKKKLNAVKIDRGIPLPESCKLVGVVGSLRKLKEEGKPGDSIFLPTVRSKLSSARNRLKLTGKVTVRKVSGGVRIWLI